MVPKKLLAGGDWLKVVQYVSKQTAAEVRPSTSLPLSPPSLHLSGALAGWLDVWLECWLRRMRRAGMLVSIT